MGPSRRRLARHRFRELTLTAGVPVRVYDQILDDLIQPGPRVPGQVSRDQLPMCAQKCALQEIPGGIVGTDPGAQERIQLSVELCP